ncbi:MAG: hypothetical protein IPH75_14755 [bacterium]|nr:hypothetical protein [bacterium]
MIEEARALGMTSLLTDTRHKEHWVLLGRKNNHDEPHPREEFHQEESVDGIPYRTNNSAIPLLSWSEFMECERLAREAGILLGQAGSVETPQLFRIMSEVTYDAAKHGKNPATAIWTAETERVLSTKTLKQTADLQLSRSAIVSPFLAVVNRGFESHAKVEGWLRYLEEYGGELPDLRIALSKSRGVVNELLIAMMSELQFWKIDHTASSLARYQAAWDAFDAGYLSYHNLIKEHFMRVRTAVADAWSCGSVSQGSH